MVVIVGGGWAGCAAAVGARQAGAEVILIERTNLLLGTGLAGGIMNNNGRFTAAQECIAMGGGYLFDVIEGVTLHRRVDFPGHRHASLYDVSRIEAEVKVALLELGIRTMLESRAVDVTVESGRIAAVVLADGTSIHGDAFVDATGTAGPMNNCIKFNGGCVMCVLRCPTFGPRVSIAEKAGVKELTGRFFEALSGSCKLQKKSLSSWLVRALEERGVLVIPIPKYLVDNDAFRRKACQQYALDDYYKNIVLLDTGHAKLMAPFFPLDKLRTIPGFEHALFDDPYAGGRGNSVRYTSITPHNDALQVDGISNLFVAGEKVGLLVGHTEAICTGMLAGHNAVRHCLGMPLLVLPRTLATGDIIAFIRKSIASPEGLACKYTFSGSVYFARMYELGLYTTDTRQIQARVEKAGLSGVYSKRLV